MSRQNRKDTMFRKLKDYFGKNHEGVVLAYLFGSGAKGRMGKLSDVDVAVLMDNDFPKRKYLDFRFDLASELSSYLRRQTEVVLLNQADLRLAHQVIT